MAFGSPDSLIGMLTRLGDPTREEQTQAILNNYGQMPEIGQGGMDPNQFVQNPMMAPNSPLQQAQMFNQMLAAGNTDQQANSMLQTLNPDPMAQGIAPGYETYKDQIDAVNALRNPYNKAMTAPRKAINNFNDAVDIVSNAEFKNNDMLTGAESVALVKKYLKQVLPDESVMGDDIQTLLSSQGVSEQYKSVVNRFLGDSGTISKLGAQEIMKTMATMAQSGGVQRDMLRGQYTTESEQYQLPTTFMGERVDIKQNPLSFEAWKTKQGY